MIWIKCWRYCFIIFSLHIEQWHFSSFYWQSATMYYITCGRAGPRADVAAGCVHIIRMRNKDEKRARWLTQIISSGKKKKSAICYDVLLHVCHVKCYYCVSQGSINTFRLTLSKLSSCRCILIWVSPTYMLTHRRCTCDHIITDYIQKRLGLVFFKSLNQ